MLNTDNHVVINFRVPKDLKLDFEWACGKDERTLSQQLRVLMAQYIAMQSDQIATSVQIENASKNIACRSVEKKVKVNKNFTRSK